ncbi:MAG: oligoendopeptidase F, partial [Magnetovibrio sp.]|nr:oligoendopeptidase F [Magnetovibrio sp.]
MSANDNQNLPDWDLSHLYNGPKDEALKSDLADADQRAQNFAANHAGKLSGLSGQDFGTAIQEFEAISEILQRTMSYGQLLFSTHTSDPDVAQFYQTLQERVTEISTHTLFFALEINRLEDADLDQKLQSEAAGRYRPWLKEVRQFRPHQLSDELEKLLHEKSVTGRA